MTNYSGEEIIYALPSIITLILIFFYIYGFARKSKIDKEMNAKSKENMLEVKVSSTVEKNVDDSVDKNKQGYIKKQQELEKSCNEFREKYRTAYDENQKLRSQNKQLDASIFELRKKVKNYEIIFENNKSASKCPCETVDTKKNKKIMENLADGYNNEKSKNKNLTEVIEFLKGQSKPPVKLVVCTSPKRA